MHKTVRNIQVTTVVYTKVLNILFDSVIAFILAIGLMSTEFASSPGDRGSIPGQVISKTQKWYLMPLCLRLIIIR